MSVESAVKAAAIPAKVMADRSIPYLISFPRTGSHWLRMILEQYFDRPLLTRSFFAHESNEYLLLHRHDERLEIGDFRETIYLYRSVVNTVFSQLTYLYGEEAAATGWGEVSAVAEAYRANLRKWLLRDDVASRRLVVTYEGMLDAPVATIGSVIEFLGGRVEPERVLTIYRSVTHGSVKAASGYDARVLNTDREYQSRRDLFRYRHGAAVIETFMRDEELMNRFDRRLLF